jgi:WD40 repeat protein
LWAVRTGLQQAVFRATAPVRSVTFAAATIFAGTETGPIFAWPISDHQQTGCFQGHTGAVLCIAAPPGSPVFASGSWDETVRIWDIAKQTEVFCLRGHRDRVWSVAFSPDGKQLVSRSADGTERIWSLTDGRCLDERSFDANTAGGSMALHGTVNKLETMIESGNREIAWYPATPGNLQSDPTGRVWAGIVGNHVLLFTLEPAASHG